MPTLLICRNCGTRTQAELASNEQDLVNVGMLERSCPPCGKDTRWGLAQDYRRVERRNVERRRAPAPAPGGGERRGSQRRTEERRRTR
ncbi:MAG: hypothetical protein HY234_04230 [Acidobacteria bacterium]|nr:hypothetical protein [Acidobacteriota bacterium]MBI3662244.1 hypothetical protein [Acidobacteriota bacterium]